MKWIRVLLFFLACGQIGSVIAGNLFSVNLVGGTLTIATTYNPKAPNKVYQQAGVKLSGAGLTLSQCTLENNGFCRFSVSTNAPASLSLSGPSGPITATVCLNAVGNGLSCENHQINVPAIIFITQNGYSGNLAGVAGADGICNNEAYMAGSVIPSGRTFKALLLSPTRYPCSNPHGNSTGSCGGAFPSSDWPLTPGTVYYQPNGVDVFNTVNANGVFDGETVTFQTVSGGASVAQFWSGIQSVHSTPEGFHIDGWAFDDMNPSADNQVYTSNLAYCNDWLSSSSSAHGSVGSAGRYEGNVLAPLPLSTWGNYYYFSNTLVGYLFNAFITSAYYTCDGPASLVCVG